MNTPRINAFVSFSKLALATCALGCLFLGSPAKAAMMSTVPTAWRLENYPSNGIYLWYTGSPCSSGGLYLPTPTEGDKNRLFALVLAAKLSNRAIFVYFDENQLGCPIISFGMETP